MTESAYRIGLFALYQVAILTGILLMPVALLARRVGFRFPVGRFVDVVGDAYENTGS